MNVSCRTGVFFLCLLWSSTAAFAQPPGNSPPVTGEVQAAPSPDAANRLMLDVVVTDKSGKPVGGLEQRDFTVLDNGHPQEILSFQAAGSGTVSSNVQSTDPAARIILLVDEVNTNFDRVAYERDQIKRFLLQNEGKLAYPLSLAFFSDAGTQIQDGASRDGNALLAIFEKHETALRTNRRSEGFYGAVDRFQLSLSTLNSLVAKVGGQPGRKIVVWISPGWPILSGPNVQLDAKMLQSLFSSIVSISTALRNARMTIYSIDPLGLADAAGLRATFYEEFLKPVTAAKRSQAGNLALQVIALQSGGLALRASNDITGQIDHCLADVTSYYTLTVDKAPTDQPNAFHAVTVKIATPGLTARTRVGYYAQP
jgi:VWFA-related protein